MSERGTVLQWEIDRERFRAYRRQGVDSPADALSAMMKSALMDVANNYGTLVVVSTPDTLTIVQRPYEPEDELLSVSDGRREAGETEGLDPKDDSATAQPGRPFIPVSLP